MSGPCPSSWLLRSVATWAPGGLQVAAGTRKALHKPPPGQPWPRPGAPAPCRLPDLLASPPPWLPGLQCTSREGREGRKHPSLFLKSPAAPLGASHPTTSVMAVQVGGEGSAWAWPHLALGALNSPLCAEQTREPSSGRLPRAVCQREWRGGRQKSLALRSLEAQKGRETVPQGPTKRLETDSQDATPPG